MSTTLSGSCRPLYPVHAVHFLRATGIGGQHRPDKHGGEVTLDNLIQMWHAISYIEPGGSDATGKVVHAQDQ
jgi:hypothetical protein